MAEFIAGSIMVMFVWALLVCAGFIFVGLPLMLWTTAPTWAWVGFTLTAAYAGASGGVKRS